MLGDGQGASKGRIVLCGDVGRRTTVSWGEDAATASKDGGDGLDGCNSDNDQCDHFQRTSGGNDNEDDHDDEDDSEGGVSLARNTTTHSPKAGADSTAPREIMADPRLRGMQRAKHREKVRQAARRGVAFGFFKSGVAAKGAGEGEERRVRTRVEAVQAGRVVEASFAKGEFGVRWRGG